MPILESPPPNYVSVSELPGRLGMTKQNLYQSGLADWIKDKFDIYKIGRTLLISESDVKRINEYLDNRNSLIKEKELPQNHPLVDDALYYKSINIRKR